MSDDDFSIQISGEDSRGKTADVLQPAARVKHERLPEDRGGTHYGAGNRLNEFDDGEALYAGTELEQLLDFAEEQVREYRQQCTTGSMRQQAMTAKLEMIIWMREKIPAVENRSIEERDR